MNALSKDPTVEVLRFGYGDTKLGLALVAVSTKGVAAILLGDDRRRLRHELTEAFPGARLAEDDAQLAETIAETVALIDGLRAGLKVPLDLRGSPLQMAVWQALRGIPVGETRSYGAIAKTLPMPATAQEVGAACAANVLAVAIPCHRVVKADGAISGYRWGVGRKLRLLALEGAA